MTTSSNPIVKKPVSKMCAGCPKVAENEDGISFCWFDGKKLGFWNDLLTGFSCNYYENYKSKHNQ